MQVLRKFIYLLVFLIVVSAVGLLIYLTSQKPQYFGSMQVAGLKEQTEIIYDFYGIPHIYADNEEDAYFALGYAHAQDRLFQMEMVRRVASGRLAEILGPDFVKVDAFFKTLGLEEHAKMSQQLYLNSDSLPYQRAARAYLAGLNEFIDKGRTPVEFMMMGIPKHKFTLSDMYLSAEYMSFNFAMAFKTDPLMSFIYRRLGKGYYQDLVTSFVPGTETIPVHSIPDTSLSHNVAFNTIQKILDQIPVSPLTGSNSWVVGPSKSKLGKVLFENDTHIAYGQPGVWYEAHIEYPGFSFYGNHLAGWPFAAIGHSKNQTWGLTMFENDDLDFFSERIKPGDSTQYWSDGKWVFLNEYKKVIYVKGGDDVTLTVRVTRHGPLMQEVMPEWKAVTQNAVAASWTHLKFPCNLLQVTYDLDHAKNIDQTRYAVSQIISPGLNVMYGDSSGNIAWWAAGRLIKRAKGVDPVLLQDGSRYTIDPSGYYDFKDNPHAENPPSGYVYSANNQPDTMTGGVYYPGYYTPEDRAVRINHLLNEKRNYTIDDMQRISFDAVSPNAPLIARAIIEGTSKSMIKKSQIYFEASRKLLLWNGDHQMHDVAPTIYYKLIYNVLQAAMEDELGKENLKVFVNTHVMKNTLSALMQNDSSMWWNDVTTKDVAETRTMIFDKAYEKTMVELVQELGMKVGGWEWGKVHVLEHVHPIGMKKPFHLIFNVGPYAVPGGPEVINQSGFELSDEKMHKAKYGPAMRIVLDFADVENSKSVLPTGQSGNIMSRYYFDQAVLYNNGKFRKQKMNRSEIENNKIGRFILQPKVNSGN